MGVFQKNDDNQRGPSSQVQVYQTQYIPTEDIAAMYSASQASLSYHDDNSYDIGTDNSYGESFDADDASTQELTVNAVKQLQRARGTANTNARSKSNQKLPPKSSLPGGSAIKMLANKASPVVKEGKVVGHFCQHGPNNNIQARMAAISYESFSAISCPETPVQESSNLAVTYTHTLQANKSKVLVVI